MTVEDIVSDEELEKAFGNASYGMSKRAVVAHTLLKRASFYHCGFTSIQICMELGLLKKNHNLTIKGGKYLWEAFCKDAHF